MKTLLKSAIITCAVIAASTTLISCGEDELGTDPNQKAEYHIKVNPSNLYPKLTINGAAGEIKKVKITFEKGAETKDFERLYITRSTDGKETVVVDTKVVGLENNNDNSYELDSEDEKGFSYTFELPTPVQRNDTYVYKVWTTYRPFLDATGDKHNPYYKNSFKNEGGAVGTIVINSGSGNASASVKRFTTEIKLEAPAKDGSSKSFFSIFTGEKYKIITNKKAEINKNYAVFWDFGYFYRPNRGACIASANTYEKEFSSKGKTFLEIGKLTKLKSSQLNSFSFRRSSLNFQDVQQNNDLNNIKASEGEGVITNLEVGEVIEFIDNKTKIKGLIEIVEIKPGFNVGDYIKFNVKVQDYYLAQ